MVGNVDCLQKRIFSWECAKSASAEGALISFNIATSSYPIYYRNSADPLSHWVAGVMRNIKAGGTPPVRGSFQYKTLPCGRIINQIIRIANYTLIQDGKEVAHI